MRYLKMLYLFRKNTIVAKHDLSPKIKSNPISKYKQYARIQLKSTEYISTKYLLQGLTMSTATLV